jgi:hypothetical protein
MYQSVAVRHNYRSVFSFQMENSELYLCFVGFILQGFDKNERVIKLSRLWARSAECDWCRGMQEGAGGVNMPDSRRPAKAGGQSGRVSIARKTWRNGADGAD